MTAKDKIRIYDLARDSVPAAITDARIQKKIQSEITRRILECAPKYGSFPKTASSCIDGGKEKRAEVTVASDQLSLAIGRGGLS